MFLCLLQAVCGTRDERIDDGTRSGLLVPDSDRSGPATETQKGDSTTDHTEVRVADSLRPIYL